MSKAPCTTRVITRNTRTLPERLSQQTEWIKPQVAVKGIRLAPSETKGNVYDYK
jgi:hypothetical protein